MDKTAHNGLNLLTFSRQRKVKPFDVDKRHDITATHLGKPPKPSTDAEPERPPKSLTNEVVKSKSMDKYRRSGPTNGTVAKAKAKAAPPWRQESPKSKKQKQKQTADKKSSIPDNARRQMKASIVTSQWWIYLQAGEPYT